MIRHCCFPMDVFVEESEMSRKNKEKCRDNLTTKSTCKTALGSGRLSSSPSHPPRPHLYLLTH